MVVEILILIAAVAGTAWVVAMFGWLWHRVHVLEKSLGSDGPTGRLLEEVAAARQELSESRGDLTRMQERVDYLERLLSAEQGRRQLNPAADAGRSEPDG